MALTAQFVTIGYLIRLPMTTSFEVSKPNEPFGVKTHMTYQDLQCVQQIPLKWTGRMEEGGMGGEIVA